MKPRMIRVSVIFIFSVLCAKSAFAGAAYSYDMNVEERKKVIMEMMLLKRLDNDEMNKLKDRPKHEVAMLLMEINKGSKEDVQTLLQAVEDPDSEIRALSLMGLLKIFKGNQSLRLSKFTGDLVQIYDDENVKKAILHSLKDESLQVRGMGVSLAFGIYGNSGELDAIFREMLSKEVSKNLRIKLIKGLMARGLGTANDLKELEGYLIDDDIDVLLDANRVLNGFKSPGTLKILIKILETNRNPTVVANVCYSVLSYSKEALPYIPVLKKRLVDLDTKIKEESFFSTRQNLERIRESLRETIELLETL